MARETNETKLLKCNANLVQVAYFEQLRKKGLHGNSKGDVVLRLADEQIRQMLKEGTIEEETAAE